MKNHSKKRGILAAAGALATAAALVLGGAVAASAQPTIPPSPGSIANLHITKLSTPPGGPVAPTGQPQGTPAGSTPIEGVSFTVQRLVSFVPAGQSTPVTTIDLTTNAGWQVVQGLTFDASTGKWYDGAVHVDNEIDPTFSTALLGTTDVDGKPCDVGVLPGEQCGTGNYAFQNMPIGVYHVAEGATPAGVTGSAPFVVTLPITNDARTDWNFNVYVYPKNSVTAITKTVDDADPYVVGTSPSQSIAYTIDADVPRNPGTDGSGNPIWVAPTAYVVEDDLNAALTPTAVTVTLTGTSVTLQAGDYTVTPDPLSSATGGDLVTVTFTAQGRDRLALAAADAGSKVRVEIVAAVAAGAAANVGAISNAALLYPDQASVTADDPIASDGVNTNWQQLKFTKRGKANAALAGAQFKVFLSLADAQAGQNAAALRGASAATSAVTTGLVAVDGVRASNFANGEIQHAGVWNDGAGSCAANDDYIVYWLTETTAPAGYELLARPIPVALLADGTLQQVTLNSDGTVKLDRVGSTDDCDLTGTTLTDVINVEKNAGFQLPLTGGMGTAILTVLGVGILAVVLVVARRRRSAEAAE